MASGEVATLIDDVSKESYGSWSPDGKYIAFASDRDQQAGVNDIFIMDQNGAIVRKITDSPTNDAYPFWSPDGLHLYFNSYGQL